MNKTNEQARLLEITEYERTNWINKISVAGMDEVGRGPLAGPVVAACLWLPSEPLIYYVNDSKKLSAKRREDLFEEIIKLGSYGVGVVEADVIDKINILQATRRAFKLAYEAMHEKPSHVLVDALKGLDIPAVQTAIIKGDEKSYLIGAASIVAKVTRDRMLVEMHTQYPEYGFDRNKGYGTAEHIETLKKYGPCPQHRRSFIQGILGEKA